MSKPKGRIVVDAERCKGCGLCISVCPKGQIKLAEQENLKGIRIACFNDNGACTACTSCAIICPDVAIEVYKESEAPRPQAGASRARSGERIASK